MHENKSRVTQPQIIQIATALDARIAAMRAGGMSATAIRRALGLSEAAALASGLLRPKAVTEASGGSARRGAQRGARGGAETRAGSQCIGFCCTPDIIEVRDASARACGLCPETLSGRDQGQSAVRARHLAIHLMRELCPGASLLSIGQLLDRDHTTVLYGQRRAEVLLCRDAGFRALHARARRNLGCGTAKGRPKKGEEGG